MSFQTHNDHRSKALVQAFRERLAPLMAEAAPDWLLHHIKVIQQQGHNPLSEEVVVQLVLRPIGNVREVPGSGCHDALNAADSPGSDTPAPTLYTVPTTRALPR